MTTRHLLDRAILRACNRDTRLAGVWDSLPFLDGNEREIALAVADLGGCPDTELLARKFSRSRTIEDLVAAIDAVGSALDSGDDTATGSLF